MRVPVSRLLPCGVVAAVVTAASVAAADPMSTSPEQAFDQGEVPTARAIGMGGALNALGVSTPSLFLNPANMPLARVYHVEGLGAYSPEARRQTYGLAIVDSVLNSSRLAGGLGGTWSTFDPDGIHRTWTDLRAALALPLGDYLSIGATARWLRVDQHHGTGPFGASFASDGSSSLLDSLTFDLGATLSVLDGLRIAVVGHNLTSPGTALMPVVGAAGIGYSTPSFAIEGDGSLDFTTWGETRGRLMGGIEFFLADHYALRGGWRYDGGTKINSPSLGLGYIGPQWGVEVSARRDLVSEHGETLGVLSLRYFYDAAGTNTQQQNEFLQPQ